MGKSHKGKVWSISRKIRFRVRKNSRFQNNSKYFDRKNRINRRCLCDNTLKKRFRANSSFRMKSRKKMPITDSCIEKNDKKNLKNELLDNIDMCAHLIFQDSDSRSDNNRRRRTSAPFFRFYKISSREASQKNLILCLGWSIQENATSNWNFWIVYKISCIGAPVQKNNQVSTRISEFLAKEKKSDWRGNYGKTLGNSISSKNFSESTQTLKLPRSEEFAD